MADATPRPEKATSVYNPASLADASVMGPRQVALCLSYYSTRNIKGQRGRLYIGPFAPAFLQNIPTSDVQNQLLSLGHALVNIGGSNVSMVLHHPKTGAVTPVTNFWVDNGWDTQRRRVSRATSRVSRSG